MHIDRKLNRAHGAHKRYKESAARGLEIAAAVLLDLGFEQLTADRLKLSKCSSLIYAHATAIANYIGGQGHCKPSWHDSSAIKTVPSRIPVIGEIIWGHGGVSFVSGLSDFAINGPT